ncbi:MAG: cation:proton antiporter [Methanofollis sp.]|nr:cation:proton antiporter [Methanofollis sp.]
MDPLAQVILILVAAKVGGELLERIGYPAQVGEIAAGILLGPSVLGLVAFEEPLIFLSEIGIIALLFVSGVRLSLKSFVASEKAAVSTAFTGVVLPFALGWAFGMLMGFSFLETFFIGTALSITSIGISVRSLIDLRTLETPSGATIVGAAVIDDVLGVILLAAITAVASGSEGSLLYTLVGGGVFLAGSVVVGQRVLPAALARTRGARTHELTYTAAIVIALLMAWLADFVGLHYSIGAFLAGMILGEEIRSDRSLFDGIADFAFGFFVTIFFTSIGLLMVVTPETLLSPLVLPLIALAFLGKVAGGFLGAAPFMATRAEALVVGFGLFPRGEIALVVSQIALAAGVIDQALFSAFTVMVVVSVILTPILMAWGYRRVTLRGGPPPAGAR